MKTIQLIIATLILSLGFSYCTPKNEKKGVHDKIKLTCYFFFIPDCPASVNNINKVRVLSEKYNDNVEFIGILSEPEFRETKIDSIIKLHNINFKVIIDDSLRLAEKYGATVTPEFFLFTSNGNLVYSGALNDYYFATGKHKNTIRESYLEDAINATLSNFPIKIKATKSFGCKIELNYF